MITKNLKNISKVKARFASAEAGFTLLEMAIIVVLGGILLSFLGAALLNFLHEAQIKTTEYRLEKVQTALGHYLSINGRYPCVANRTLGLDNNLSGREVTSSCNGVAFPGTVKQAGVRIGSVPTRTLNLPDEFIADAWGRKFTYAVTEVLATPLQYRADAGVITLRDDADSNIVTNAHYVVLSHGTTGDGGFPLGQSTVRSLPCPTSSLDRRNCDDSDAIFRKTLVNSEANIVNFYDDYVYFKGLNASHIVDPIPTGAVMGFQQASCPVGWADYLLAEGKFIIGLQSAILVEDQYIRRRRIPAVSTSLNLSVGTVRDFARPVVFSDISPPPTSEARSFAVWENIPPYVAVKYCEKLPL